MRVRSVHIHSKEYPRERRHCCVSLADYNFHYNDDEHIFSSVQEDIAISPVRNTGKGDSLFVVVAMVCMALVLICCAAFIIARCDGFLRVWKSQIIGLARGELYRYFLSRLLALHLSMQFGCEAITKWLSQHDANPLLQNQRGRHGYSVANRVQLLALALPSGARQLEPSKMGPAADLGNGASSCRRWSALGRLGVEPWEIW
jgi:hypothetical protein